MENNSVTRLRTYPVHLTDIMDGQSIQAGLQRNDFATSPFKENRTRAVREYEQTIDQLKKENFDLKMEIFLTEEENRKRLRGAACSHNADTDNCVEELEINVNLRVEIENLRKELNDKDQELQAAIQLAEKHALELKEMQEKHIEQEELSTLFEQFSEVKEQYMELVYQNESLSNLIHEKEKEIEEAKNKLEELETKNIVLEDKVKKRNLAIQGFCEKHRRFLEEVPKDLRPIIKDAVNAARNNNKTEVISALESFKASLCEMMPKPSKLQASGPSSTIKEDSQLQDSSSKILSSTKSSESLDGCESSNMMHLHVRKHFTCKKNLDHLFSRKTR